MRSRSIRGRALAVTGLVAAVALAGCGGSSSPKPHGTPSHRSASANLLRTVSPGPGLASATQKPSGEKVLASIHAKRPSASHQVPHLGGFDESSIATFAHEVDTNVGAFWQAQLNQAGYSYTPANEDLIEQPAPPVQSGCGGVAWTTDTQNAAYCSADNTFYLPTGFLGLLGHNFGDTAVAVAIAHENGHHIQQLLGVLQQYHAGMYHTIQIELQADCLAGVWMASEYQRGDIQTNDLRNALVLYNDLLGDPSGTPTTDPHAHGSGAQRWASFMQGYNSGQGGRCEIPALPTSES